MMVRIDAKTEIENPRNYPGGTVEELRILLMAGAIARPDARRASFWEIDTDQDTFFIHVSPVSGKVMLVAKWLRELRDTYVSAGQVQDCPDFSECL